MNEKKKWHITLLFHISETRWMRGTIRKSKYGNRTWDGHNLKKFFIFKSLQIKNIFTTCNLKIRLRDLFFYLKPIIALGSFAAINNPKLFWMSSLFCSCHIPTYLMPRFGAKNVLILHIYLTRVLNIMIWFLSKMQDILQ